MIHAIRHVQNQCHHASDMYCTATLLMPIGSRTGRSRQARKHRSGRPYPAESIVTFGALGALAMRGGAASHADEALDRCVLWIVRPEVDAAVVIAAAHDSVRLRLAIVMRDKAFGVCVFASAGTCRDGTQVVWCERIHCPWVISAVIGAVHLTGRTDVFEIGLAGSHCSLTVRRTHKVGKNDSHTGYDRANDQGCAQNTFS